MNEKYAHIIDLSRHISPTREPMSAHDRAAQFAPYSALSGYEETVEETARLTERRIELDEGEIEVINRRLTALIHKEEPTMAKITYFEPDRRKSGGKYITLCGEIAYIDSIKRLIRMIDGRAVPIDEILGLEEMDDEQEK